MNTQQNYQFVPAYYEWHFIDKRHPEKVLLNWIEPLEDLYDDYNKETGEYEDEPHLMTEFDEVQGECEAFIERGLNLFEEGTGSYFGVNEKDFMQLPVCAAKVMARALYDHYIA